MKSTTLIVAGKWPKELEPLRDWLVAQGVDLSIARTESALLELTRLIGRVRFSNKMRRQSVRWRLLSAQDRLCFPRKKLNSRFITPKASISPKSSSAATDTSSRRLAGVRITSSVRQESSDASETA